MVAAVVAAAVVVAVVVVAVVAVVMMVVVVVVVVVVVMVVAVHHIPYALAEGVDRILQNHEVHNIKYAWVQIVKEAPFGLC